MEIITHKTKKNENAGMHRRRFLTMLGGTASVIAVAASCNKDDGPSSGNGVIDLGSGDTGILNYAYALEQLEAAFYTQVIATPYTSITDGEKGFLTNIRDHEIAHREFFKAALGSSAIPALEVNFSAIDFTNRDSVLGTAKAFEDLGVSAYNGAGQLITNVDYLLLAGKIVSVEARHAAYIREIIAVNTFADTSVIDMNGLDMAALPPAVLATASMFLKTKISGNNLPTS